MRRHILVSTGAVLLTGALLAGCGNDEADEPTDDVAGAPPAVEEPADSDAQPATQTGAITAATIAELQAARAATAVYVPDANAAIDAGYLQLTQLVDGVGIQYLDPNAPEQFDATRPQLLVYTGEPGEGELAAVGWAFAEPPAEVPIEGATFGEFPAACHYDDGSYVPQADEAACEMADATTGAAFTFWHADLTTVYAWAWMPNPDGVFAASNPLLSTTAKPADPAPAATEPAATAPADESTD